MLIEVNQYVLVYERSEELGTYKIFTLVGHALINPTHIVSISHVPRDRVVDYPRYREINLRDAPSIHTDIESIKVIRMEEEQENVRMQNHS